MAKHQYNLRHIEPALECVRCGKWFFGAELNDAEKHANSDAEHLDYEIVGYVKRPLLGVALYPLFLLFRDSFEYTERPSDKLDEKWLKWPEYKIFIKDRDGKQRFLQKVAGSQKVRRTVMKKEIELYEEEGRKDKVIHKKFLGIIPYSYAD